MVRHENSLAKRPFFGVYDIVMYLIVTCNEESAIFQFIV